MHTHVYIRVSYVTLWMHAHVHLCVHVCMSPSLSRESPTALCLSVCLCVRVLAHALFLPAQLNVNVFAELFTQCISLNPNRLRTLNPKD